VFVVFVFLKPRFAILPPLIKSIPIVNNNGEKILNIEIFNTIKLLFNTVKKHHSISINIKKKTSIEIIFQRIYLSLLILIIFASFPKFIYQLTYLIFDFFVSTGFHQYLKVLFSDQDFDEELFR
jgi:hypothetical protein